MEKEAKTENNVTESAVQINKTTKKDMYNFDDVQPGVWYYDAVTALATVGLVNGYPDNTFLPNNNARRCEVAQIIYNLIGPANIEM